MAGYFECKTASNGQFMFNLKAGNHEVILTSELYATKAACTAGIESVQKNAPADVNFTRKLAKDGSHYSFWEQPTIKPSARARCTRRRMRWKRGIASVKANAPGAAVKDLC